MKTERFASAVRMSLLPFGRQSALPIRYLTPDIGDGLTGCSKTISALRKHAPEALLEVENRKKNVIPPCFWENRGLDDCFLDGKIVFEQPAKYRNIIFAT